MGLTVDEFLSEFDANHEDWDAARNLDLVRMAAEFLHDQVNDDTWPKVIYRAMFRGIRKALIDAEELYFPGDLEDLEDAV